MNSAAVKEGRVKTCMQTMTAKTIRRVARGDPLPSLPGLLLAGADEAGRGALAGPVAAAAVKEGRIKTCMQTMTAKTIRRIARGDPLPPLPGLLLAGADEAGRGALAGPVAAAAVILPERHQLDECRDSKTLPPWLRRRLARKIKRQALSWAFALADVHEIAEKNILQAALLAMSRALRRLGKRPDAALIDGPHAPPTAMDCYAVVAGDARVKAIGCASILAKVMRDELMGRLHSAYPQYGFAQNKGYGTAKHLQALKRHGACPQHRKDFAPVRACIRSTSGR